MFREQTTNKLFGDSPARRGLKEASGRTSVRIWQIAAILAVPLLLLAYPSNPPAGESGAKVSGGNACGNSCHFHASAASSPGGATVNFPTSYTPGGAAVPLTVTLTNGTGGFELSAVQGSGTAETQAGSLAAGTGSAMSTLSGIQYIYQTATASTWSFSWTPPATAVGNVTMDLAVVSGGQVYQNSYTLMAAAGTPPPAPNMLTATPASLTFNYASGTGPGTQSVTASSSGSSIPCTTSVSTSSGGNWLSATPSGGPTPLIVSVSVKTTGLAAGTYTGMVTITASGAGNSQQTVPVTLNVTAPPPSPATPTLSLSTNSMTFSSSGGASVTPKNVQLSSSGSPVAFMTSVNTTTGGNWLSANTMSGMTPATVSISANPNTAGMTNGTYQGKVTFTASGVSNSSQTLNVTLTVTPAPPPPTSSPGTYTYSFSVLDKQSDGSDYMMLDGKGTSSNGQITGGGNFTRFQIGTDGEHQTVAMGTWTAKSFVSYSPASTETEESSSGGVLAYSVELNPAGGTTATGSMRIADTGADRGVTLTIDGGSTFSPTGTGSVSIGSGTGGYCISPPTPTPYPTRPTRLDE